MLKRATVFQRSSILADGLSVAAANLGGRRTVRSRWHGAIERAGLRESKGLSHRAFVAPIETHIA